MVGIVVVLLIMLFIMEESCFDIYYEKVDWIYCVLVDIIELDNVFKWVVI